MHTYLKSIGFGSLKTEQELEDVLNLVFRKYTDRQAVREDNGTAFVERTPADHRCDDRGRGKDFL